MNIEDRLERDENTIDKSCLAEHRNNIPAKCVWGKYVVQCFLLYFI